MQQIVFLLVGIFASVGFAELPNSPPATSDPAENPSGRILDIKDLLESTGDADRFSSQLRSVSLDGINQDEPQPSARFLNNLLGPILRYNVRYDYDGFDSPEDYNDVVRQGQPNDSAEPDPFDYGSAEQAAAAPPPPPPVDNGLNRVSRPFRRPTGFGGYGGGGYGGGYGGGGYGSPSGYGGYGYGGGYGGGRPVSPHRGHRGHRGGNRTGNRRPLRNNKRIPGSRPFAGIQSAPEPFVPQEIGPDPVDFSEPIVNQEPAVNKESPQKEPQDVQETAVV